jgi:hypothetical protein
LRPREFEKWCEEHRLDVKVGVRLAAAAQGDLARAAEFMPLLDRFPEDHGFSDDLKRVVGAGYSYLATVGLLDRGVNDEEIYELGSAHLAEDSLDGWLSTGLSVDDIVRAVDSGWKLVALRAALDVLETFQRIQLPVPPTYDFSRGPAAAEPLAVTTPHELARREHEFLERCDDAHDTVRVARSLLHEYISAFLLTDFVEWFDVGISASAPSQFAARQCAPEQALQWLRAGWTPSQANSNIDSTGDVSSVVMRATRPWTDYFSRTANARYDHGSPTSMARGF